MYRNRRLRRRAANRNVEATTAPSAGDPTIGRNEGAAPVEWDLVLANERDPVGIGISDHDLVVLASEVLLNRTYNFQLAEGSGRDAIAFHPKLFHACHALRDDPDMGGYARVIMGQANLVSGRHIRAVHHLQAAIAFCPDDWRVYEALADSFAYLKRFKRALDAILVAEKIVLSKSYELGKFRIQQKKGQLFFRLSRYGEAIDCLEQALIKYDTLKGQLSPMQIGETAQAQYMLCSAYTFHERNRNKYQHHWVQATEKFDSLPRALTRGMAWRVKYEAEGHLRDQEFAAGKRLLFSCFMMIFILISFMVG